MEPQDVPTSRFDPAEWEFHVRHKDGHWLSRPEIVPDQPASNAETWTRRIPDSWSFDSHAEAQRAARSHGARDEDFDVISAPRRPGEWLAKSRVSA